MENKLKRIIFVLSLVLALVVMVGCDTREKFHVLSWGGYINTEMVEEFEKEFGVRVIIKEATSNESMHNLIQTKAGSYDIVIPSDYMIERMLKEDMLHELDFSKIPNYSKDKLDPKLEELVTSHFPNEEKYAVPYFWGTLGIMYNKDKAGVEELVKNNSWGVFFESNIIPKDVRVGMYDSSRDAVAAAELYLNESLNTTSDEVFTKVEKLLKEFKYSQWGTDELKDAIVEKNLDIALVYSGDFFDMLYFAIENEYDVTFDMFVPQDRNNIWFDAMVIPKTAKNIDLAHEFINFFQDEEVALENALYIGYCPTIKNVYETIIKDTEIDIIVNHPGYYPGTVNGEVYRHLGDDIAKKMDEILTKSRYK